jgi:hypothetical protein
MPPDAALLEPPMRTFAPTRRIIGRELHGDLAAVKLECGHVLAVAATAIAARCAACRPIEVLRG